MNTVPSWEQPSSNPEAPDRMTQEQGQALYHSLVNEFALPVDWNGHIQVQGNVVGDRDENGTEHVISAESLGVPPEFWGVYAGCRSGIFLWLADLPTQPEAENLARRLMDQHELRAPCAEEPEVQTPGCHP